MLNEARTTSELMPRFSGKAGKLQEMRLVSREQITCEQEESTI